MPNAGLLSKLRSFSIVRLRRLQRTVRNRWFVPSERLAAELRARGLSIGEFLDMRRRQRRQYVEGVLDYVRGLGALCPAETARLLEDARRVLRHEFDLLGSGPFVPVDGKRPPRAHGYRPIDWYLDPVRGLRFPEGVPHKAWDLYRMRPGNADIKYPWELGRCQHLPTLAQAWQLTRRREFAREIFDQIADFMEANPLGLGIQWTCTMDVAIRAANWAIALALTLDADVVPDEERAAAYAALFDHGKFIFENLENTYEVTSNHFLSNIVGLHLVAAEFCGLPQADAWDEFCRRAVQREMMVQVHEEGSDYESSIPYHRLVTELFLASYRLAQFQRRPLPDQYAQRLRKMVQFLLDTQRPDGRMPVIGDADDGRFHIFTDYARWDRQDARHLYAPAALVLGQPQWLSLAPAAGRWEAAWWGFDPAGVDCRGELPPPVQRLFPAFGVAVIRDQRAYLVITNGKVGTNGFGNHKHNELLGFEYHVAGVPLLVDPGSYVYTSDFDARNRFRSTASHNTVMIDGAEQNEMRPEWIFRAFESAEPEHLYFAESGPCVVYVGRHKGYCRTARRAVHERRFELQPTSGTLRIVDRIVGSGTARVQWHFHAAPGVTVAPEGDTIVLRGGSVSVRMTLPPALTAAVRAGLYSPSYGVALPCQMIDLEAQISLDGSPFEFCFLPEAC